MKDKHKQEIPNPGSDEAFKLGCCCSFISNNYGVGVLDKKGNPQFYITEGCPVHSPNKKGNKK
jgi:hypothetical protein